MSIVVFSYLNILIYVYSFLTQRNNLGSLSYYFLTLMGIFFTLISFSLLKSKFEIEKIDFKKIFFSFFCVAIYSYLTLLDVNKSPLWLDEYIQIVHSYDDMLMGAAVQQQPPGGIVLTKFLGDIIGIDSFLARMTGFIPMLLALWILITIDLKEKGFYVRAIIISTIFIETPFLRYISLEGRAVSFGIFNMAIWLSAIRCNLENANKHNSLLVLISSFMFLNSVGLQPLSIMLLFIAASGITLLFFRRKEYFRNLLPSIIATILFVPIQIPIFKIAVTHEKFNYNISERLLNFLEMNTVDEFLKIIFIDIQNKTFLTVLVIIGFALFIKKLIQKRISLQLVNIFLMMIAWPVLFYIGFKTFINWTLEPWYYFTYTILITFFVSYLISLEKNKIKISCSLLAIFFVFHTNTSRFYGYIISWRPDWEKVHRYISKEKKIENFYVAGECDLQAIWCYNVFVGLRLFGEDKSKISHEITRLNNDYYIDNGMVNHLLNNNNIDRFSITIIKLYNKKEFYEKLEKRCLDGVDCKNFKKFFVITTKRKLPLREELPRVLKWMAKTNPRDLFNYYPYEVLIWYYYLTNNKKEAAIYATKMLDFPRIEEEFSKHPFGKRKLFKLKELRESLKK